MLEVLICLLADLGAGLGTGFVHRLRFINACICNDSVKITNKYNVFVLNRIVGVLPLFLQLHC